MVLLLIGRYMRFTGHSTILNPEVTFGSNENITRDAIPVKYDPLTKSQLTKILFKIDDINYAVGCIMPVR